MCISCSKVGSTFYSNLLRRAFVGERSQKIQKWSLETNDRVIEIVLKLFWLVIIKYFVDQFVFRLINSADQLILIGQDQFVLLRRTAWCFSYVSKIVYASSTTCFVNCLGLNIHTVCVFLKFFVLLWCISVRYCQYSS